MNLSYSSIYKFMNSFRIQLEYLKINYDEKKVPQYILPDPFRMLNGKSITCPKEWWENRRPEILRLFQEFVYGKYPKDYDVKQYYKIVSDSSALSGLATRKEITISLIDEHWGPHLHLLIYVPNDVVKPVPTFLALNFYGNHTIHKDPGIRITPQLHKKKRYGPLVYIQPSEKTRGIDAKSWQVDKILREGYALATTYYGDLQPDYIEGYRYGIRSIFSDRYEHKEIIERRSGFRKSKDSINMSSGNQIYDWGAIGVWAWGLSLIMNYIENDSDIRSSQVVLFGHSRLGKAALWAGAQDNRFAIIISNNSGCGGAALSRRRFGETIKLLNLVRPHWFTNSFKIFNGKEDKLPVDQHMLIALIAPRPVYVASAENDLPADPLGEFCSVKNADSVYKLLGLNGLGVDQIPILNRSVGETIGYHIRNGNHEVTVYDWEQFLNFTNRHLG